MQKPFFLAVLLLVAVAQASKASILIGTAKGNADKNGNDVNALINAYYGTNKTYVGGRLDQIIVDQKNGSLAFEQSGTSSNNSSLSIDDFDFFVEGTDENGTPDDAITPFGESVDLIQVSANDNSWKENHVAAIQINRMDEDFEFYVAKNNGWFSVWKITSDDDADNPYNMIYTDAGAVAGDPNFGNAFAQGDTPDDQWEYSPWDRALSNVQFFAKLDDAQGDGGSDGGGGSVPEPASLIIWTLLGVGGSTMARRLKALEKARAA